MSVHPKIIAAEVSGGDGMRMFLMLDPPTATAQMTKVALVHGKPRFYKPTNVQHAKDILIKHLRPFKPKEPIKGPVELHVLWLFPRGKRHKHGEWRVTKPDTDNLQKLLKDCMTQLQFWQDDSQVVKEICEKRWSDEPCGISITYDELPKVKEGDNYGS